MTRSLLERLLRQPDDEAAWLVLADALAQEGDPAGELILTQQRFADGDGGPTQAELEALAARTPDAKLLRPLFAPRPALLPFRGGGAHPVVYDVHHDGKRWHFTFRKGELRLDIDGGYNDAHWTLSADDGEWDAPTTTAYLSILSAALRAGALPPTLPTLFQVMTHADFVPGDYPRLPVPGCGRDHAHDWRCESERAMAAWAEDPWRWIVRRLGKMSGARS